VFVVRHKPALGIHHLIRQATGLVAFAPVGAAPGVCGADVALTAIGHAERAVHKEFQRTALGIGCCADGRNLAQVQFACQHDLRQPHVLQKACLLGGADIGLGAGMQLDRRQVDFQQAHVLNDQRVHAGVIELPGEFACALEFVVT